MDVRQVMVVVVIVIDAMVVKVNVIDAMVIAMNAMMYIAGAIGLLVIVEAAELETVNKIYKLCLII